MKRIFALFLCLTLLLPPALAESLPDALDKLQYELPLSDGMDTSFMQAIGHTETVNGVEITIREAGYDGCSLIIQYSYRLPELTEPLGDQEPGLGDLYWIGEEEMSLFTEKGVGNLWGSAMWIDNYWINGQCMGMSAMSAQYVHGSETPGEIIFTDCWRLDNDDIFLSGELEITLPIGEVQPLSDFYPKKDHPDKYGADGELLPPEKGVVTFTMDAGDGSLRRVYTRNTPAAHPFMTVKGAVITCTPLMTYIDLALSGEEEDILDAKLYRYRLTDSSGTLLFGDAGSALSYGTTSAEFLFPCLPEMPRELWLAPVEEGVADMEYAIRLQ